MAIIDPNNIKVGQTVRFKTLNPHDNIAHAGKVTSICDYTVASRFEDVDVYYQEVKRVLPDLGDKETLTYWLMDVSENGSAAVTRVFAIEIIDVATLEIIEENTHTDIRVYDIDSSKAQDVLSAIKKLGYVCEIVN